MMESEDRKKFVKIAVAALEDKKGIDVRVIDISRISSIGDYFIIANGTNSNQVQALADNVEEELAKAGLTECKVEGYSSASWILLDYNDIIIHIFSEEDRFFYNLERIWKDGIELNPAEL